jgi:hypothetical protein
MKRIRLFLVLFTLAALTPVFSDAALQSLRAQITVTITLVVTNLGYAPHHETGSSAIAANGSGIVARLFVNKNEDPQNFPRAENLSFVDGNVGGNIVAQAARQGAVEVQASISPNPTGTLLYADCTAQPIGCGQVTIPVTAGSTSTTACAYSVVIDTTQTSWTLEHGLFSDFEQGGVVGISGKLMFNNTHIATPLPAYTPFIVYSDGQSWAVAGTSGGTKTFCVDLKITVPTSVLSGMYSSNATYSLYY